MNKIIKIKQLFVTISYLKSIQIYYRLYYFFKNRIRSSLNISYSLSLKSNPQNLILIKSLEVVESFDQYKFSFLNIEHEFIDKIDWNYAHYGKLWTYNLTYFDYLNHSSMDKMIGINLISDFISQSKNIKDGLEPFPISLRGINWIKFLVNNKIEDNIINDSLYAQYMILLDNIEYHLLGNHLLENGFSLLFGAYYFKDEKLYKKAIDILINELEEQILDDGAHFELSPMYHQIMFFRILDCINLLQNNKWKEDILLHILEQKASLMFGWLLNMSYDDGKIPLLNDSANYIAPTSLELFEYAKRNNIEPNKLPLGDSGYRSVKTKKYACVLDIGNIGPDYIPGHAHSDTFSFELYVHGKPFIIDTGTSTYETNTLRMNERGTKAHNTVMINQTEQSKIWGGFRVAERAKVFNIIEKNNYISAMHDGYKKEFNALHQREFIFHDDSIKIIDIVHTEKDLSATAYLHFAPDVDIIIEEKSIICDDITILFSTEDIHSLGYMYAPEFNKTIKATVIEIVFTNILKMEIKL